jgi:hypothetical protein
MFKQTNSGVLNLIKNTNSNKKSILEKLLIKKKFFERKINKLVYLKRFSVNSFNINYIFQKKDNFIILFNSISEFFKIFFYFQKKIFRNIIKFLLNNLQFIKFNIFKKLKITSFLNYNFFFLKKNFYVQKINFFKKFKKNQTFFYIECLKRFFIKFHKQKKNIRRVLKNLSKFLINRKGFKKKKKKNLNFFFYNFYFSKKYLKVFKKKKKFNFLYSSENNKNFNQSLFFKRIIQNKYTLNKLK